MLWGTQALLFLCRRSQRNYLQKEEIFFMAKDYNIDDILSEVKQRRAEQESNLKSAPAPKAAPVQTDANREAYAGKLVEELLGPEKLAVKPEPKEKKSSSAAAAESSAASRPGTPGESRAAAKSCPCAGSQTGTKTRRTQGRHCRCAGAAGAPQAATPAPGIRKSGSHRDPGQAEPKAGKSTSAGAGEPAPPSHGRDD